MNILLIGKQDAIEAALKARDHTVTACTSFKMIKRLFNKQPHADLLVLTDISESTLHLAQKANTFFSTEPVVAAVVPAQDTIDPVQLLTAGVDDILLATPGTPAFHNHLCFIEQRVAKRMQRTRVEVALRERDEEVRAILDTTVDGIVTIDQQGVVNSFNAAAERIFGYAAHEVIGHKINMLMPTPFREEHDSYMQAYHDTGVRKIIGIGREVTGLRKDGTTFPMDLAVSEIYRNEKRTYTGIIRDISERRQLEKQILLISAEERQRIGQDLHDGLGQMLTGIGLITSNLARRLEREENPLSLHVTEIADLIKEADQQARILARGLIPVDLDASGLAAAMVRLVHNAERLFGIRCTFEEIGSTRVHDSTAATHFYRIAQEAVSNAAKHSQATLVKVLLATGSDQIRLRVKDNGIGITDNLTNVPGMGIRIMHYRARIIGATLDIRREPKGGTILTCTWPSYRNRI